MPVNARKYTRHPTPMSRRPAASRSALELTSRQICVFRAVFADEGLGAANRTRRAGFLAASVPLEHAEIVRPTQAPPTRALRRRGVVSLGKALTDSMAPTTKLAHPFDCLRSGGEHDRQLCQFRRHGKASAGLLARRRRRRHRHHRLQPANRGRRGAMSHAPAATCGWRGSRRGGARNAPTPKWCGCLFQRSPAVMRITARRAAL